MSAIIGETLLRTGINSVDTAIPTTKRGIIDLTGSPFATLACLITGTNPSFTVQPLLWNVLLGAYVLGDAATLTESVEMNIAVNGTTDLYIYVSAVSGTNPNLDVCVKPALL